MTQILGRKRFAVLLINFTDSVNPQPFSVGQARLAWETIDRFWQHDSYNKVNLLGSQVFDWQTYPSKRQEFTTANSDAKGAHRAPMIAAVKKAFAVDTAKFEHVIIIFSEAVGDAWTSGQGSIFEPSILATSTICHEMTHQFGEPDHSWDLTSRVAGGAPGEYYDQTDIMSAQNCWTAGPKRPVSRGRPILGRFPADPFTGSGPHHCMFWKEKFGWLDDTTLTRISDGDLAKSYDHTFTLYSRNEPVAARLNCIQFSDIWAELDVNTDKGDNAFYDDFDTGLKSSGVVIHQQKMSPSGKSVPFVLVTDVINNPDQKMWAAGQVFERSDTGKPGRSVYVWVKSVDTVDGTALVNISSTYPRPLTRHQIVGIRKAHSTAGGQGGFDYISHVGVVNEAGATVALSRSRVVAWIDAGRNSFYVQGNDGSQAEVIVEQHWLQTHPDSNPANNLLSLPNC